MTKICLNLSEANWSGSGIAEYERRISNLLALRFMVRGVTYRDKVFAAPFPVANSLVPYRYCFDWRYARFLPVPFHWITGRFLSDDVYVFFRNEIPFQRIRGKVVAVIHDLIPLRVQEMSAGASAYRARVQRVLDRADIVVTVSEFSRQDIAAEFGYDPNRISIVPPGVDLGAFTSVENRSADLLNELNVPCLGQYFLYIGSHAPQKNLKALLTGYAQLPQDVRMKHPLVLSGERDELANMADQLGIGKDVCFIGFVSGSAKIALYHHARAFVFLSSYEGFGMPILEAMAAECPVVCSNCASLPEVAGDAALVVNPDDAIAVADALMRVLEDDAERDRLICSGRERAKHFMWSASAEKMANLVKEVAND